jgi:CO/xanthine dehydrogenase FAD-binding subunit
MGSRLEKGVINAAGEAAREAVETPDDTQASQAYRQQVLATLVRRNVVRAAERTGASA